MSGMPFGSIPHADLGMVTYVVMGVTDNQLIQSCRYEDVLAYFLVN